MTGEWKKGTVCVVQDYCSEAGPGTGLQTVYSGEREGDIYSNRVKERHEKCFCASATVHCIVNMPIELFSNLKLRVRE